MLQKIICVITITAIVLTTSCNKEEGTGGEGSIKGVVVVKNYNSITKKIENSYPATDHDVFVIYGNNVSYGDKVSTNFDGTFEIKYLTDGRYKVFVYSEDTTGIAGKSIAVSKEAKISDGKTVSLDTFYIINNFKPEDATGQINGIIYLKEYDREFKYLQRIIPAGDKDIYLSYAHNSKILDRVQSSFDGTFNFSELLNGDYKVFAFCDNDTLQYSNTYKSSAVINVTQNKTTVADTLFIYKGLDIDEGNATISGKITLINYKSNGYEIKDIAPAQDYDVFLVYGDHITYDMDTKTDNNGMFTFSNLIKGDYVIYVYSEQEDEFGNLTGATEQKIHKETISIISDKQKFYVTDTVKTF